jgi:uncharacterized protein YegL
MPQKDIDAEIMPVDPGESHLACVLLLDTSGSMSGEPLKQLVAGVNRFNQGVSSNDISLRRIDLAIVAFNDKTSIVQNFRPLTTIAPEITLSAGGSTNMGEALLESIELTKTYTQTYKVLSIPHHRSWVIMITDGAANGSEEEFKKAAEYIKERAIEGRTKVIAIGVNGYYPEKLKELTEHVYSLDDMNFAGLFNWLRDSMKTIGYSDDTNADIQLTDTTDSIVRL